MTLIDKFSISLEQASSYFLGESEVKAIFVPRRHGGSEFLRTDGMAESWVRILHDSSGLAIHPLGKFNSNLIDEIWAKDQAQGLEGYDQINPSHVSALDDRVTVVPIRLPRVRKLDGMSQNAH